MSNNSHSFDGTSRSDKLKPINSKRTHKERVVAEQVIADIKKQYPKLNQGPCDIDQMIDKLKYEITEVRGYLRQIDAAVRAGGGEHNRQNLKHEVERMLLQRLEPKSKDELVLLFTVWLGDQLVREIV